MAMTLMHSIHMGRDTWHAGGYSTPWCLYTLTAYAAAMAMLFEQAEAVGAVRVVGAGHHAHRPRMVPWWPHRTECILRLHACAYKGEAQPGGTRH